MDGGNLAGMRIMMVVGGDGGHRMEGLKLGCPNCGPGAIYSPQADFLRPDADGDVLFLSLQTFHAK